jgi:hypothetical protein
MTGKKKKGYNSDYPKDREIHPIKKRNNMQLPGVSKAFVADAG